VCECVCGLAPLLGCRLIRVRVESIFYPFSMQYNSSLFYRIHGQCIGEFAPRLLAVVPKRIANIRTVRDALTDRRWISDIRGSLTVGVIADFLSLWDALANMELQMDSEDKHIFRFASDGEYLANVAYDSMFIGSTQFAFYDIIWKTWAPSKCKFFMWLPALRRCWTADRLQRRGLDHPDRCLLCDQAPETVNHLLTNFPFAREFWFHFLGLVNLQTLAPQPGDCVFMDWWEKSV
jgi:hypothetical protein